MPLGDFYYNKTTGHSERCCLSLSAHHYCVCLRKIKRYKYILKRFLCSQLSLDLKDFNALTRVCGMGEFPLPEPVDEVDEVVVALGLLDESVSQQLLRRRTLVFN
jgi:hypothetical protein